MNAPGLRRLALLTRFGLLVGAAVLPLLARAADLTDHPTLGVRLAKGFRITPYADEQLANDIWSMTLDPRGRVVVAGPGYIRTLHDTDSDGVADKATLFTAHKGAMGLCFNADGTQLFVVGDGWLSRYADADLDGVADGAGEKILPFAPGEHGGHAVRLGPDGWWYVIAGNDAVVGAQHVTLASSPIKEVEAGALVRLSPDLKTSEVIAHGFRNPYDFDFNAAGDLFTYDSDTERDYFLPWYSGCRIYHVALGKHHGWRLRGYQRSFRRLDGAPDTVPCLVDLGRGSPTGVVCYRGTQFPERFRGGILACDWTFGRVHFLPLTPDGVTYRTKPETFLEPIGTHGFAPTDIVVTPDGAVFISIGGRKTRGAVYRITFENADAAQTVTPPAVHESGGSKGRVRLDEAAARTWDEERVAAAGRAVGGAAREDAAAVLLALRRLELALGDWRLEQPSAEVFAPYESALRCDAEPLRRKLADAARPHLASTDRRIVAEAARMLAMLEDDAAESSAAVAAFITPGSSATDDFHFLAVLARLRGALDAPRCARAVLDLDRKLAGGDRRPKQMWPLRLAEVVAALVKREPRIAEELLAAPGFATAARLPMVEALGKAHEHRAAELFLAAVKADAEFEWSPALAALLRRLPAEKVEPLIREREPRLPAPAPPQTEDAARWEALLKTVDWPAGDAARGEALFRERACTACHGGATPFGPDLAGAAARLSPADLFRAIVFPSREVAEVFRATAFTLRDGSVRQGLVAFLSADGVIVQTGPGTTERLAEGDITARAPGTASLMPAGLLEGVPATGLADLHAYLRTLRQP